MAVGGNGEVVMLVSEDLIEGDEVGSMFYTLSSHCSIFPLGSFKFSF